MLKKWLFVGALTSAFLFVGACDVFDGSESDSPADTLSKLEGIELISVTTIATARPSRYGNTLSYSYEYQDQPISPAFSSTQYEYKVNTNQDVSQLGFTTINDKTILTLTQNGEPIERFDRAYFYATGYEQKILFTTYRCSLEVDQTKLFHLLVQDSSKLYPSTYTIEVHRTE